MNSRPSWPFAVVGLGVCIAVAVGTVSLFRGCGTIPSAGAPGLSGPLPGESGGGGPVDIFSRLSGEGGAVLADGSRARCPFTQIGHDFTLSLSVEPPNARTRHLYLLVVRKRRDDVDEGGGVVGTGRRRGGRNAEVLFAEHTLRTVGGGPLTVRYSLAEAGEQEQFRVGDEPYALSDGRVLFIDMTADPVRVRQVDHPLDELLPDGEPTVHDLRAVRGKLEARHPAARDFWGR